MRADSSWKPGRSRNSRRPASMPSSCRTTTAAPGNGRLRGLHLQVAARPGQAGARRRRQRIRRGGRFAPQLAELRRVVGHGAVRRESADAVGAAGLGARHSGDLGVADFLYKCTELYSPAHEKTLAWDDAALNIDWPLPAGVAPHTVGQGCARQELRRHREVSLRVLVLGGAGQVGRAVAAAAPAPAPSHRPKPVRSSISAMRSAVESALAEAGADWIVNAAAYTAVDLAEDERAQAIAVNDTAVGVLAAGRGRGGLPPAASIDGFRVRRAVAIAPICPSDPTHPLSVYGVSKLGGERRALSGGRRTSYCAPPGYMPPQGAISC